MVSIVETAFMPAVCAISLFQRGDMAVKYQAAPNLSADLLSTVGASVGEYLLDPTATAALSGELAIGSWLPPGTGRCASAWRVARDAAAGSPVRA